MSKRDTATERPLEVHSREKASVGGLRPSRRAPHRDLMDCSSRLEEWAAAQGSWADAEQQEMLWQVREPTQGILGIPALRALLSE